MALQVNFQGQTNALGPPAFNGDGAATPNQGNRMGKYNEVYVASMFPTKSLAALAGNYYSATAASATVVVTSLQALTEASPALIIENTAPAGGPNMLMDFIRIDATAVAALATDHQYTFKVDNIRNKWASAGTTVTPQNCSAGYANSSVGTVHFGALVVATAQQSSSFAKTIAGGFLNPTATAPAVVLGDLYEFRFGAIEAPMPTVRSNVASNGVHTFGMCLTVALGPLVLGPGTTLTLFLWNSNSASQPSYTLLAGWYEY